MKREILLSGTAFILGMGLVHSFAGTPTFLLTIDDSNPSAVTITATGANPIADDTSGLTANDGVDLLGFYNQPEHSALSPINSTLQGGNLTVPYNFTGDDNYSSGGGSLLDLSLYSVNDGSGDSQTFSTTQPAFTGSMTLNLSGLDASALPAVGTTGDILSGFSENPGVVIGQWQVEPVPEPGTGSLLLLGSGIGFIFWRRRSGKDVTARS